MSDRHPAQSTYPSLNTNLPSARAKKRTRQRSNQQKRARVHDTYIAFTQVCSMFDLYLAEFLTTPPCRSQRMGMRSELGWLGQRTATLPKSCDQPTSSPEHCARSAPPPQVRPLILRDFLPPFGLWHATHKFKLIGEPDYPETERITADTLVQWVEDLAWTLNGSFFYSVCV